MFSPCASSHASATCAALHRFAAAIFSSGASSAAKVAETLAGVERAAREGSNVVPPVIDAVKAYATLGEISDVLRKVFGTYREDGRF